MSHSLIEEYFAAFNRGDTRAMLEYVADDVRHEPNQGESRIGRERFGEFLAHMDKCYAEELRELEIFTNHTGTRAAAEFVVHGQYKATDSDLPVAHGQRYVLPAGTFFEIADGKIARITTYYNLENWLQQVR